MAVILVKRSPVDAVECLQALSARFSFARRFTRTSLSSSDLEQAASAITLNIITSILVMLLQSYSKFRKNCSVMWWELKSSAAE